MKYSEFRIRHSEFESGDVAQRESTCLARRGSAVQIRSSPPERDEDLTVKILKSVFSGILDCKLHVSD
jgi:hypothetical protein